MSPRKYSAAYIIAFHFGSDMRDVSECRYQPTRFVAPAVYTLGAYYYCCPSGSQKPATDHEIADRWQWEKIASYYGRDVYRAPS